jgi:nucleotide-binding universal stress UspA family protein
MTAASSQTELRVPRTFVVPLDGSDFANRAVPVTADLARRFGADVVLMTAPTSLDRHEVVEPPAWLDDLANATDAPSVETVVSETNDPVAAVVALLATRPDPVVAMATHGRGVVGTTVLGGVAQRIVREAGRPLLLLGKSCPATSRWAGPVLVCHDGSTAADAALGPAAAWAGALGLPIALVHVFHPLDVATAEAPRAAIRSAIEALGPATDVHVVRNSRPADSIHDVVQQLGASLVVMSTHGRTGFARVTLGRVAMDVVHHAQCPVLIAPPS